MSIHAVIRVVQPGGGESLGPRRAPEVSYCGCSGHCATLRRASQRQRGRSAHAAGTYVARVAVYQRRDTEARPPLGAVGPPVLSWHTEPPSICTVCTCMYCTYSTPATDPAHPAAVQWADGNNIAERPRLWPLRLGGVWLAMPGAAARQVRLVGNPRPDKVHTLRNVDSDPPRSNSGPTRPVDRQSTRLSPR